MGLSVDLGVCFLLEGQARRSHFQISGRRSEGLWQLDHLVDSFRLNLQDLKKKINYQFLFFPLCNQVSCNSEDDLELLTLLP